MGTSWSLFWCANASEKPKKPRRRFLRNLFVSAFALTFFLSLYSLTPEQIVAKAIAIFSPTLPGFQHILQSKNGGKYFELETALYLHKEEPEEVIEGFGLEIMFYGDKINANINGEAVVLPTTEFDVITRSFVVECKSAWSDAKGLDGHLKQFIKEQNMIAWMGALVKDLAKDRAYIRHQFKDATKSNFFVCGRCTFGKIVKLSCSWVNQHTSKACIDQFVGIVHMLAKKSLLVLFKTHLDDELAENFYAFNIDVFDSIEYVARRRCRTFAEEVRVFAEEEMVWC